MSEISQQWRDSGSGAGHLQAVFSTVEMRVDEAYRNFIEHTVGRSEQPGCKSCRESGEDCPVAVKLRHILRDAKTSD